MMLLTTDVTQILNAIQQGDPSTSDQLLPLVYEELRELAGQRLANEKPGQPLQATALVHEAYLRLVGKENDASWDNRGHFFAAAAEAVRRILIDLGRGLGRQPGRPWFVPESIAVQIGPIPCTSTRSPTSCRKSYPSAAKKLQKLSYDEWQILAAATCTLPLTVLVAPAA